MGKSKGGKYHHAPRTKPTRLGPGEEEASSDEEERKFQQASRGMKGQAPTAGMLPPSDSEEEEEEEQGSAEAKPAAPEAKPAAKPAAPAAKKPAVDESSDEDSDDSDSSDGSPGQDYLTAPRVAKKPATAEERDADTIRKDLERLELIRKKREQDRLKRIATEGWDRFAPVTDTNRPPGAVPSDHPSQKA